MKKKYLLKSLFIFLLSVFTLPCFSAASPLFMPVQPSSVEVSYGATAEALSLQFYIVNNSSKALKLSNYQLTAINPPTSNPITVLSSSDNCGGIIPSQANAGTCLITVNISAQGNQSTTSSMSPIAFQFSLNYGSRQQTLTSNSFNISFATGNQITNASRTVTVVNNCPGNVWVGVSSGATNSINVDPAWPTDLQSCVSDTDCYPGSQCIQVQPNPVKKHCFWNNPVPGTYELTGSGGSTTMSFPVYDNGIPAIWSGGIAARTGCTGAGCTTGDCGGGTGACPLGQGFTAPVTTAEFTFLGIEPIITTNSGYTAVDTYDITIINGVVTPTSMNPTTATWGGTSQPYTCGEPGNPTAVAPLAACNWDNFVAPTPDYVWVDTTTAFSCTTTQDCTTQFPSNSYACGHSVSGSIVNSQATCGNQLGFWTADAVCAIDSSYGAPFNCANTFTQDVQYTLADLFGCSVGELNNSCYTPGANNTCCGCENWSSVGIVIPSSTEVCQAKNPNWTTYALPTLEWLKRTCPTAYVYPYDDASSTFTCQALNAQNINVTNYTVTFCPEL